MINLRQLLPKVYYNESRDFQLLMRIYEIMFNYLKTNVDMISYQPLADNSDNKFLDLLCTTLGLKLTHQYNNEDLSLLCTVFVDSIRNKGNIKSIKQILNLLICIEGCTTEAYIEQDIENTLYIYIPSEVKDLILFKDVLEYIIPTGTKYKIINQSVTIQKAETKISNSDNVRIKYLDNSKLIMVTKLDSNGNQIISEDLIDIDTKIENKQLTNHEGLIVSGVDNLTLQTK